MRVAARSFAWFLIFVLELLATVAASVTAGSLWARRSIEARAGDVRIDGPKQRPHLVFACESPAGQLRALLSRTDVIRELTELNAGVGVSVMDLSPDRAQEVLRLNQAGIPVTAGLDLPKEQGYYLNASNEAQAANRYTEFVNWTHANGLRWARVGLDIEPDARDFAAVLQGHWLRVAAMAGRRYFDNAGVMRARARYTDLIRRIERDGYPVETYQFPLIADERKAHTTLLERLFGIVDVRGGREVLMTYSSFNHAADSALVWQYAPAAQAVAVGTTTGDATPGSRYRPLSFDELTRDIKVAAHFSPVVGVFSLEGSVERDYLSRLASMDWSDPVTIPAEANRTVAQLRGRIRAGLWAGSHLPSLAAAILLADLSFVWRRKRAKRRS